MTPMANWLSMSVQLTQSSEKNVLFQHFCTAVKKELAISAIWIFTPCDKGRLLVAFSGSRERTWSEDAWQVSDFTHPLAHVLRSSSSILLDDSKLGCWHQHAPFQQMIMARQKGDSILIQALPTLTNKIDALLVVCGAPMLLAALLLDKEWQFFCQILINQHRLLNALKTRSHEKFLSAEPGVKMGNENKKEPFEGSESIKQHLIGESQVMCELRQKVLIVAQSSINVLIQGETGTGKEVVALALHNMSERRDKAMVAINCAAIPENLLETELFGYAKGAFSGAISDKKGLIAEAEGGTLFLDEIGDMPLVLQAKLLRVLETRIFRPVGGKQDIAVNFRLVSATHVALKQYVEEGKFRLDLYFRLNQFPLMVPTLNARAEDLPELVVHFIGLYNQANNAQVTGIHPKAMLLLQGYNFSGNVRELKNLIDYACVLTVPGKAISARCFEERLAENHGSHQSHVSQETSGALIKIDLGKIRNLKKTIRCFESDVIRQRLDIFGGDRALAAESLGLPKRTLAHKCLKLEIEKR